MKYRIGVYVCSFIAIVSLLACKLSDTTTVQSNGSGEFRQEIGYSAEEMTGRDPRTFCQPSSEPNFTVIQEHRAAETWCIVRGSFSHMSELQKIYNDVGFVEVNQLEIRDRAFIYDVDVDWTIFPTTGADVQWRLTMPGKIGDNNSDKVDGHTLTWSSRTPTKRNLHAVSSLFVILPPAIIRPDR